MLKRRAVVMLVAFFCGGFAITYFVGGGFAPLLVLMRGLSIGGLANILNPVISDTSKKQQTKSQAMEPESTKPGPSNSQSADLGSSAPGAARALPEESQSDSKAEGSQAGKEISANNTLEISPAKQAAKQVGGTGPSISNQDDGENGLHTSYTLSSQGPCTSLTFGNTCGTTDEAHGFLYKLTPVRDVNGFEGITGSVNLITAEDIIPQLSFYTTKVDIPDRSWTTGFPGYPELRDWFGVCYDGGYEAPATGSYTLVTAVDDSVAVWIDERLIMNSNDGAITKTVVNNYTHGPRDHATRYLPGPIAAPSVYLTAGLHRVMIKYMQGWPVTLGVQVWIYPPGRSYPSGTPSTDDLMRLVGPPGGTLKCPH